MAKMTQHFLGEGKHMPEAACPNCGCISNTAAAINENDVVPKPGDVSICIECGHLAVLTNDLLLRNPTDEEIKECAGDRNLVLAMEALHRAKNKDG